jgi:hypothetical protein
LENLTENFPSLGKKSLESFQALENPVPRESRDELFRRW